MPEAWLRGPVPGVTTELQPAAHALVQAGEELASAAASLTPAELWVKPGGAASVGFHLKHVAGATDRLLTYARGGALSPVQMQALAVEGRPGEPPADAAALLTMASAALEVALETLRGTDPADLDTPRTVGRAKLPTTVRGLLCHTAEHALRHAGQAITTAKIVKGMHLGN